MISAAESANRTARAIRLVEILDRIPPTEPISLADFDALNERALRGLAALDGGRPISPATRAAIRTILEARQSVPADPFAGLPA